MTHWAYYRERERTRLAAELAAVQSNLDGAIAALPWYGRWPLQALYSACKLWARLRR